MEAYITIGKIKNTWIIFHSTYATEIPEEVHKFKSQNVTRMDLKMSIGYDTKDEKKLKYKIEEFERTIRQHRIVNYLYDIEEKIIAKIVFYLLEETKDLGLVYLYPLDGLLPRQVVEYFKPAIRRNKQLVDSEIYNNYMPCIKTARQVYSNENNLKNIKSIVHRIYIDPKHKLQHSMFDSEGKRLINIFYDYHDWHPIYLPSSAVENNAGKKLMLAGGAFGFEDPKAILFLAFQRVWEELKELEAGNWKNIDYQLSESISRNFNLLNLYKRMREQNIFNVSKLIQYAPLAPIMPDKKIYLFEDTLDEAMKHEIDNFYPNLNYELII